jgi:hypothetical protein
MPWSMCPRMTVAVAAMLWAAACPAAVFDNTDGLDACLTAALQAHPGLVSRWEVEDGTGRGFAIEVVAQNGGLWRVTCPPNTAELRGTERATGVRDFATMSSRAQVGESTARETVRTYYPGRFILMEYQLTWRGGAVYNYEVITRDDRQANVEVDASSGRIVRTRSEARY